MARWCLWVVVCCAAAGDALTVVDGLRFREVRYAVAADSVTWVLEAAAETQEALLESACETGDGDPYGAVLWPSAVAVARHAWPLATGRRVLEMGCGTGLCALAAAQAGAAEVLATDFRRLPLALVDRAAVKQHLRLATRVFDLSLQQELPRACGGGPFDLVLAADVMYEPSTGAALARHVARAYHAGARVLVGDSPGRPGRPVFLETLGPLLPAGVAASFVDVGVIPDHAGASAPTCLEEPFAGARVALLDLCPPNWSSP